MPFMFTVILSAQNMLTVIFQNDLRQNDFRHNNSFGNAAKLSY